MGEKLLFTFLVGLLVNSNICEASTAKLAEAFIKGFTVDDVLLNFDDCDSKNFTARTGKYGYVSEEYDITTEDGYILRLFRIKSNDKCKDNMKNVPVLLLPGAQTNGMSFTELGPKSSIAYGLSDLCYDVWIGNFRGTRFSRKHITLSPKDPKFWEFSLDEYAKYDTTAFMDKILDTTDSDIVNIIGYSEGGATYLALASSNKEYHDKIGVGITLEPSAYMYFGRNIIMKFIANDYEGIYKMLSGMTQAANLEDKDTPDNVFNFKCPKKILAGSLCRFVLEIIKAGSPAARAKCVLDNAPEPMTLRTIKRYAQHMKNKVFQMIDLGAAENKEKYGDSKPPNYDVSKIKHPVAIVYGRRETIVTKDNLVILKNKLGNVLIFKEVEEPSWGHPDFIVSDKINTKIIPILKEALDPYSD